MAPDRAVLEQPPAFLAVAVGAGDVIDHTERSASDDIGIVHVDGHAFDVVAALPLSVGPVGIGAVARTGVQHDVALRLDLDRDGLPRPIRHADDRTGRDARAGPIADVDLRPAELLDHGL